MKKIMMLLGVVAIAASVHAASVSWSFNASGTTYTGYTIYLTTAAGTFASEKAVQAVVLGSVVDNAKGVTVSTGRNSAVTGTITGLDATTAYKYYWVAIKDSDYWVSDIQSVTTGAETAGAVTISMTASNGKTLLAATPTGSFGATPAPEPTSGLLILLGMAGLALKRKVA